MIRKDAALFLQPEVRSDAQGMFDANRSIRDTPQALLVFDVRLIRSDLDYAL